jgi:hypothetical protein
MAEKEAERAATVEQSAVYCPECRRPMADGAVLCTNCGYNLKSGKKTGTDVAKAKPVPAKAAKPGKKKDALAPEGSFFAGLAVSFGFALAASLVWFGVAWGLGWDVYFLALLIGAAAGLGMQLGQKGYSTMGGFGAAGITLTTILLAKFAVVLAIIMPMLDRGEASADDDGPDSALVEILADNELKAKSIDPDDPSDAQYEAAHKAAVSKAKSMSRADKEAAIAKAKDDETRAELKEYLSAEILKSSNPGSDPTAAQEKSAEVQALAKVNAMSAAERQTELKRLEAKYEADMAAEAAADAKSGKSDAVGTMAGVGFLFLLGTVLFGIKSAIFSIVALFLAYRTAAGSMSD